MKKILVSISLVIVIIMNNACSSSSKISIVGSWVDKEKIQGTPNNGVFIVVVTQNMTARSTIENDLAAAAKANGIRAVTSLAVFTPVTGVPDSVVISALLRTIDKSACTAILTITMIDATSETKYHPSSEISYNPYSYYPYYGNFSTYCSYSFGSTYSPGYYTTKNTYFLESNLYAYPSQEMLFSVQTKAVNPEDISKGSKQFTETLIEELKSNGLLKGKS